jgi:Flp pilus assembly protein TadD
MAHAAFSKRKKESIMFTLAAALIAATTGLPATSDQPAKDASQASADTDLSAAALAQGKVEKATLQLQEALDNAPDDPALLINLGVARAHVGLTEEARALFTRALASPEPIELETADGRLTDSRRLARRALAMLERGEFDLAATRGAP